MGVSNQSHAAAALCHRERTFGTHWTGGWADLRAGLDTEEVSHPFKTKCKIRVSYVLIFAILIGDGKTVDYDMNGSMHSSSFTWSSFLRE
jgi:hypothetical protein